MRVFITGANGFIARALTARLQADGHTVTGMDLAPAGDTPRTPRIIADGTPRTPRTPPTATGSPGAMTPTAAINTPGTVTPTGAINTPGTVTPTGAINTPGTRTQTAAGDTSRSSPHIVAGDVSRPGDWQDIAADLVIHTAAVVSNGVGAEQQWRVNVVGTKNALDAAIRGGAARFVHFSSIRAFSDLGFPDGVTEEHPVRPDGNPYVDTKIAGEQVVLQAHAAGRIAVTIVRPGDVYGPGSRPWTLMPLELIRRNRFLLPAHGRGIFSPVYIDDLIEGVRLAATTPAAAGQIFTLTGGAGVTCADFFAHYYRMLGRKGPRCLPTPVAVALAAAAGRTLARRAQPGSSTAEFNAISMRYFARTGTYSIDKARRLLGYEPAVDLEVGMARTAGWLRANGLIP